MNFLDIAKTRYSVRSYKDYIRLVKRQTFIVLRLQLLFAVIIQLHGKDHLIINKRQILMHQLLLIT